MNELSNINPLLKVDIDQIQHEEVIAIQQELLHGDERTLIAAAISDPHHTDIILYCCEDWLNQQTAIGRTMAIKYIHALGAKHHCQMLVDRLINEPSWHIQKSIIEPSRIIGGIALIAISQLCSPYHPARKRAVMWALNYPALAYELWLIWPPSESLLPLKSTFLNLLVHNIHVRRSEIVEQLALRAALLHENELPELCTLLAQVDDELKRLLMTTLDKQLRRTKNLKLLRTCRVILY